MTKIGPQNVNGIIKAIKSGASNRSLVIPENDSSEAKDIGENEKILQQAINLFTLCKYCKYTEGMFGVFTKSF